MRRFEASPRRATPKGHKTFIHCTAPPSPGPTYRTPAPAFMAHGHTRNITPCPDPWTAAGRRTARTDAHARRPVPVPSDRNLSDAANADTGLADRQVPRP